MLKFANSRGGEYVFVCLLSNWPSLIGGSFTVSPVSSTDVPPTHMSSLPASPTNGSFVSFAHHTLLTRSLSLFDRSSWGDKPPPWLIAVSFAISAAVNSRFGSGIDEAWEATDVDAVRSILDSSPKLLRKTDSVVNC